jgi:hypothetical protein
MATPWASQGDRVKCLRKAGLGHQTARALMVNHSSGFGVYRMGAIHSFIGRLCASIQYSWPADSCWPRQLHRPTAASSSSPISPTGTASTSASPAARNAARMPPYPTASRGNSPRSRRTGGSIRMKSPARFPRAERAAAMPAARNTSRSPASAEAPPAMDRAATPAPWKRRDAAPRSGYGKPRWPRLRVSKPRGIA